MASGVGRGCHRHMNPLLRQTAGLPGRLTLATALAVALLLGAGTPDLHTPAARAEEPSAAPTLPPAATRWHEIDATGEVRIHLYFGWTSTCPHCAAARPFIDELSRKLPWLAVHSYQLDGHDENVQFIAGLADSIGESVEAVPIFFFGGRLVVGFDSAEGMGARLRSDLEAY